jgi:hypothetical protein
VTILGIPVANYRPMNKSTGRSRCAHAAAAVPGVPSHLWFAISAPNLPPRPGD